MTDREIMSEKNALSALVGKTVTAVEVREVDNYDDGENVQEVYSITCSDGEVVVVTCDSGCSQQWAHLEEGDCTNADD